MGFIASLSLASGLLVLGAPLTEVAPANELGVRGVAVLGRQDSEFIFLVGAIYRRRLSEDLSLGGFADTSVASIGHEYDRHQSLHRGGVLGRADGEPLSWLRLWAAISAGSAVHVSSAGSTEVEPLGEVSGGLDVLTPPVAFGPFAHAGGGAMSYVGYGIQVLARF